MDRIKKFFCDLRFRQLVKGFVASAAPMLFGAYPFGAAYILACGDGSGWALVGCLAGCLVGERIAPVSMLVCAACFVALREYTLRMGRARLPARLVIALIASLLASAESFALYSSPGQILLYSVCCMVCLPSFTMIFYCASRRERIKNAALSDGVALCCLFVVSRFLSVIVIAGAPLGLALGCFFTLYSARKRGFLYGGICGFICGLACGAPCAAALGIIGITFGMLENDNAVLASLLSCMLALSAYAYLADFEALPSAAVMLALPSLVFLIARKKLPQFVIDSQNTAAVAAEVSLKRFAAAFSSLSGVFYTANGETGLRTLADEYGGLAGLFDSAASREQTLVREDKRGETAVASLLSEMKIECGRVSVTGLRIVTVDVFGVTKDSVTCPPENISALISGALKTKLGAPEYIMRDGKPIMRLQTVPRLRCEMVTTCIPKEGEEVCGDTVSSFDTSDLRFCCLISDGMGSGGDAALTSRITSVMLEKLISVGADTQASLKTLNRALISKKSEVFATVDLLEVDKVQGQALLTKAGAAPSYLIRAGECRAIEAFTPPMGIMDDVLCESFTLSLRRGDFLVMISDGALPRLDDDCLPALLSGISGATVRAISSRVLDAATASGSADDISVCVIRFY